jgi:hypothetical protein
MYEVLFLVTLNSTYTRALGLTVLGHIKNYPLEQNKPTKKFEKQTKFRKLKKKTKNES